MKTLKNAYPPNIFLTYANTPLKNNPDGLYKTVEAIPKLPYQLSTINESIDKMVELERRKGRKDVAKKPNCNCGLSRIRKGIFSPETLTCYECDHQSFVYILTEITNGREFSAIEEFDVLLMFGHLCFGNEHDALCSFSIEKERIKLDISFLPASEESPEGSNGGIGPFSTFFAGAVAKSLLSFLADNDRKKLKKCELCKKYYIAKRVIENQKYCPECSPKNKMSKKQFKLYMRTYRKKGQAKKERMRAGQYEARILRYMKDLDLTPDEAKKLIEEEKTM